MLSIEVMRLPVPQVSGETCITPATAMRRLFTCESLIDDVGGVETDRDNRTTFISGHHHVAMNKEARMPAAEYKSVSVDHRPTSDHLKPSQAMVSE